MTRNYRKQLMSLLLCLTLTVGLFTGLSIPSNAADTVYYLSPVLKTSDVAAPGVERMETQSTSDYTLIDEDYSETYWGTEWTESWYVVSGGCSFNQSITIYGDVKLILLDDCNLTVTGDEYAGISVTGNNSLTIYAGNTSENIAGSGQLTSTGSDNAAGIGGHSNADGNNITINGGIINATGGEYGAGIGGGAGSSGTDITINNGIITATGTGYAAGIGGGSAYYGNNIVINGGKITATGSANADGIGSCDAGVGSGTFISIDLTIKAGSNAKPDQEITNTGDDLRYTLSGEQYVTIEPKKSLPTADMFIISENEYEYDETAHYAKAAVKDGYSGLGAITLSYYDADGNQVQAPTDAGTYSVKLSVAESDSYSSAELTSEDWILTITEPEKPVLAQIGESSYNSLAEAVAAVPAGETETTITMVDDESLSETVIIDADQNITLDLKGNTITSAAAVPAINNLGTLVIVDSANAGGIQEQAEASAADSSDDAVIETSGTLTIESGTITDSTTDGVGVKVEDTGTVNVDGGSVYGTYSGISSDDGTINIDGGTVSGDTYGIVSNGTVTVNDGTVSGGTAGISTNTGSVTVNGGTIDGALSADADSTVSITGGAFSDDVSSYLSSGYQAVQDETSGTWSVQMITYTVAVQSRTQGTDNSVANVSGGGAGISSIDGTALSAPSVSGYTFIGWYTGYSASGNDTKISDSQAFTYYPTADITVTAVYQPKSGTTFQLSVDGSEFKISGKSASQTGHSTFNFGVGTSVTVNYTDKGKIFLYWANDNDKVVSKSTEYTFILGSNTNIHAVYAFSDVGSQASVIFLSAYEQILSSGTYTTEDTIQFPSGPSKMGYDFIRWVIDDGDSDVSNNIEATEANIKAAMASSSVIKIIPVYKANEETYSITITYKHGSAEEVQKVKEGLHAGDQQIFTADATYDGADFSYWYDGTNILSYSRNYVVVSSIDVSLTAVYGAESTVSGTSTVTSVTSNMNGSYYRLTFTETYSIPDGCTLVKTGFVRTYDEATATEANLVVDAANTKTYVSSLTESYGAFSVNLNLSDPDKYAWMRGYVQYTDQYGTIHTVYSSIAGDSYNSNQIT